MPDELTSAKLYITLLEGALKGKLESTAVQQSLSGKTKRSAKFLCNAQEGRSTTRSDGTVTLIGTDLRIELPHTWNSTVTVDPVEFIKALVKALA